NSAFSGNLFYIYYKEILIISFILLFVFIKRQQRNKTKIINLNKYLL
ncbi:TPA: M28 family metallopeptidase, partial [Clostridium botulinum]